MKIKKGYITHMMGDKQMMIAAGPAAKNFHGFMRSNETAAFIIDCMKQDTTKEEVLAKMKAEYDVSDEIALRDIDKVIEALRKIGALEE